MSIHHSGALAARQSDRLRSVAAMTSRIAGTLCLDQLLSVAVETISGSIRNSHVGLMLIEGDRLVLRAASDQAADQLSGRFSLEIGKEGITGWVAATGQSLFVPDVSRDPRYVRLETAVPVQTALAVPLRINHKIIGVVDVDASQAADLSEDDLHAVEIVADHIALAIDNAFRYCELERYAGELEEEVRRRTAERDEAMEYLATMKTTFENNDAWKFIEERESPRADAPAASFDPLVFARAASEPIFPESSSLTAREVKILELIAEGLPDKAIAQRFVISPHTVNAHLRSIYRKLGTHSRTGAVNLARLKGIIE